MSPRRRDCSSSPNVERLNIAAHSFGAQNRGIAFDASSPKLRSSLICNVASAHAEDRFENRDGVLSERRSKRIKFS
jgi:hypothetical protein